MSENARKAVVTTAQVRDAFASYASALVKIGQESIAQHEFDKGLRGRGFAEYDQNGNVVQTFETKDDALNYYSLVARGAWLVLDSQESHASVEQIESAITEGEKTKTRKATQTNAA